MCIRDRDPATTTPASTQNVRSATTSASLKHSATKSLSSLPPETTSALYRRHQHRPADDQTRAVTIIFELVFQAPSGAAVGRGKWGRAHSGACRSLLDAVRSRISLAWSRRVRDRGLLPGARDADS